MDAEFMKRSLVTLALCGAALVTIAGCSSVPSTKEQLAKANGQYWQRAETTSALYMRGPKAQQMLNQDIARCTGEIRELQRLGAIRTAMPGDNDKNGNVPDTNTPEGRLAQWDSPERDGYLYAEHLDYHDFETCMQAKGWERVEYMPYKIADEARDTYVETIIDQKRRSKEMGKNTKPKTAPQYQVNE